MISYSEVPLVSTAISTLTRYFHGPPLTPFYHGSLDNIHLGTPVALLFIGQTALYVVLTSAWFMDHLPQAGVGKLRRTLARHIYTLFTLS